MPYTNVRRQWHRLSVLIDKDIADAEEIQTGEYAGGVLYVPAGSSLTSVTFYVADSKGGTYLPLYDQAGLAVSMGVSASRAYEIPTAVFGAAFIKIIGDASSDDQTAYLTFKS